MKKYILLFALLLVSTSLFADELIKPESVVYDSEFERWLVSDVGQHQEEDGRILVIDETGAVLSVLAEGLTDPKGILISNGSLFVTDLTKLVQISLADGSIQSQYEVSGASFLNDICIVENNIYLSDNMANKIFKFDAVNLESEMFCQLTAPNGMIYSEEDNAIYAVSFSNQGKVYQVDLETKEVTTKAHTDFAFQDGIARDGAGKYYISNWSKSNVNVFDNDFNYLETLESELNGPADIYFSSEKSMLVIPVMDAGEVLFIEFLDAPGKPLHLVPGDGSTNMPETFNFYWDKCDRAFAYTVYISKDIFFDDDDMIMGNTDTEDDTTYVNVDPFDMESIYYWYVEAVGLGGSTNSDTILFITKGYNDVMDENPWAVSVFPLPMKDKLNVTFAEALNSEAQITIVDVNGREVMSKVTFNSENSLNISELPKGIYFLVLEYDGRIERAKLVK